jgi:hypothetical protein
MAEESVVLENLDETDMREQFRYMAQLQAAARVKQKTGYNGHVVTTSAARNSNSKMAGATNQNPNNSNMAHLDETHVKWMPPPRPSLFSSESGPGGSHTAGEEPSLPHPQARSGRDSNPLPPHLLALQEQVTLTDKQPQEQSQSSSPESATEEPVTTPTDDNPDPNSMNATVVCLNCDSQLRFPKTCTLVVCPNCQTVSPGSSVSNFPS